MTKKQDFKLPTSACKRMEELQNVKSEQSHCIWLTYFILIQFLNISCSHIKVNHNLCIWCIIESTSLISLINTKMDLYSHLSRTKLQRNLTWIKYQIDLILNVISIQNVYYIRILLQLLFNEIGFWNKLNINKNRELLWERDNVIQTQ